MKLNDSPSNEPLFVQLASEKYKKFWESLSQQQKQLVESQASLRILDTTEKVDRFLESRDFGLSNSLRISAENQQKIYNKNKSHLNESQIEMDPITKAMKLLS